jgi:hypothetical protein
MTDNLDCAWQPISRGWLDRWAFSAILMTALSTSAIAQDVAIPDCALNPPKPTREVTVAGFPAERLYLHRKHPSSCTGTDAGKCNAGMYVISGDKLKVSENCANWTFAEFHGKKTIAGWVLSGRVPENPKPTTVFAESIPTSKYPACLEAEAQLNSALQMGRDAITGLKSALSHPTTLAPLPDGSGGALATAGTAFDVQVQGKKLKAIAYSVGGSCAMSNLELWNPTFSERIPITGSNVDMDQAFAEGDDLVSLHGRTYFMHDIRGVSFLLARFGNDLSTSPMCKIDKYPTHQEVTISVDAAAVCDAVLTGHVDGAPVADVEPIELSNNARDASADNRYPLDGAPGWQLVARGHLDIDNDGKQDFVGMISRYDASGAGCGHDFSATQPIKLNAEGMPEDKSQFNRTVLASIERPAFSARVFQYQGTNYVEYLSKDDADGLPFHEVWKYSPAGAAKSCGFIPVRFRATDTHGP